MKLIGELVKSGILFLVLVCGTFGFALGIEKFDDTTLRQFISMILGLALLSGGSLALNQVQEWSVDQKMDRTKGRPIPSGRISRRFGLIFSLVAIFSGLSILSTVSPLVFFLGAVSALLYNGFYTLYWKPRLVFAAVPGAIPGAMPVLIGYAASGASLIQTESVYIFLIMFLWQMPHFWALAIRYQDDYSKGGFPVLPVRLGVDRTLFHLGLYTLAYLAMAISSPWFVRAGWIYLLLVVPFVLKVLWEFVKFLKASSGPRWLPFFMWTNLSLVAFLLAPVLDKWILHFSVRYLN